MGIEPMTSSLPMTCSTAELQGHRFLLHWSGWRESNPRLLLGRQGHYHYATPARSLGREGFEPPYRDAEQIYSLSPLTTRPPTHTRPICVTEPKLPVLLEIRIADDRD